MTKRNIRYGLDDRLPTPIIVPAGFQHVLTLLGPAVVMTPGKIGFLFHASTLPWVWRPRFRGTVSLD
jgi:xanthine/uracil permease